MYPSSPSSFSGAGLILLSASATKVLFDPSHISPGVFLSPNLLLRRPGNSVPMPKFYGPSVSISPFSLSVVDVFAPALENRKICDGQRRNMEASRNIEFL
jgi:hypothetical protein